MADFGDPNSPWNDEWPKSTYVTAPAQLISITAIQQPPLPDRLIALDATGVLWVLNDWTTWTRIVTEPRK